MILNAYPLPLGGAGGGLQSALEEPDDVTGFLLGALVRRALCPYMMRGVGKHHYQRLVVHAVKYVSDTPASRARHLPHKPEEAMGTLMFGP